MASAARRDHDVVICVAGQKSYALHAPRACFAAYGRAVARSDGLRAGVVRSLALLSPFCFFFSPGDLRLSIRGQPLSACGMGPWGDAARGHRVLDASPQLRATSNRTRLRRPHARCSTRIGARTGRVAIAPLPEEL